MGAIFLPFTRNLMPALLISSHLVFVWRAQEDKSANHACSLSRCSENFNNQVSLQTCAKTVAD